MITVRRGIQILLAILVLIVCLVLYLQATHLQSAVNTDRTRSDQGAYARFVRTAYDSQFTFTGGRNRMPLYPYIQALFYSPDMDDEALFQNGKNVNVALSLVSIFMLAIMFFAKFSRQYALYAILVIAFLVFAIKAPYFQTEILFYTIFAFAFILSIESLIRPKWYKVAGVGLLYAIAHYTKASALPGLIVFASSYVALYVIQGVSKNFNRKRLLESFLYIITPLLIFFVVLFPYFNESKAIYGSYLYNVNTTFYMWYDSWDQVATGTKLAGDRVGWPDMPDDEIPSLRKYLSEHSINDIVNRLHRWSAQLGIWMCHGNQYTYGYCGHVMLNVAFLAIGFIAADKRELLPILRRNLHVIWFVLAFFLAYTLSFIWYMPISSGVRTILTLMIPFMWITGMILHLPSIRTLHWKLFSRYSIRFIYLYYLVVFMSLVGDIYQVVIFRAATMYGGN